MQPVDEKEDKSGLCKLVFLIDTTIYPNDLNTKLQRNDQFSNDMCRFVKSFKTS